MFFQCTCTGICPSPCCNKTVLPNFLTSYHDSFLQSFSGGLIHHVVQDGWQMNAFRQLRCIRFGGCRHALEMDLGFLIITAAQK